MLEVSYLLSQEVHMSLEDPNTPPVPPPEQRGRICAAWPPGYNSTYLSWNLRRCGRSKPPTG